MTKTERGMKKKEFDFPCVVGGKEGVGRATLWIPEQRGWLIKGEVHGFSWADGEWISRSIMSKGLYTELWEAALMEAGRLLEKERRMSEECVVDRELEKAYKKAGLHIPDAFRGTVVQLRYALILKDHPGATFTIGGRERQKVVGENAYGEKFVVEWDEEKEE